MLVMAQRLEKIALEDEYFIERRLYPNVDFYSGITLKAVGIPHGDVHRHLHDRTNPGLDRALAGDGERTLQDRQAPPALPRPNETGLRTHRPTRLTRSCADRAPHASDHKCRPHAVSSGAAGNARGRSPCRTRATTRVAPTPSPRALGGTA